MWDSQTLLSFVSRSGHDPARLHALAEEDSYGRGAHTVIGVCAAQTSVPADVGHHLADGVDAQRFVLKPYIIEEFGTVAVMLKQPGALRVELAEV